MKIYFACVLLALDDLWFVYLTSIFASFSCYYIRITKQWLHSLNINFALVDSLFKHYGSFVRFSLFQHFFTPQHLRQAIITVWFWCALLSSQWWDHLMPCQLWLRRLHPTIFVVLQLLTSCKARWNNIINFFFFQLLLYANMHKPFGGNYAIMSFCACFCWSSRRLVSDWNICGYLSFNRKMSKKVLVHYLMTIHNTFLIESCEWVVELT